jgi:hypothetical protein
MQWLAQNAHWIFEGVGALLVASAIGWLVRSKHQPSEARQQNQRSGAESTNIQTGRDIMVGRKDE